MISILETFLSIQGEGYHTGQTAYFIRTQGCDIGCHWCDEPKSWELNGGKKTTPNALLKEIRKTKTKIVIFTGGEPLMHDLTIASNVISQAGYKVHLETSGAYPLTGEWDWITLSPKKIKSPLPEIYTYASELKVIIHNHDDFNWALDQEKKTNHNCLLYLQPEWGKIKEMKPFILDFIKKNTRWNLSLQMHKYLNIK